MDNQERNREALIEHIAAQDRIIRRRNDRIAEVEARADELARELAHAVARAEKAELESGRAAEVAERWREAYGDLVSIRRADPHRPLTADDITDEMIDRAYAWWEGNSIAPRTGMRAILAAALTPPPSRPEEKVEAVLHQYWSGDIDGTDLADLIVEEMNR